jgi:hypothetical protein
MPEEVTSMIVGGLLFIFGISFVILLVPLSIFYGYLAANAYLYLPKVSRKKKLGVIVIISGSLYASALIGGMLGGIIGIGLGVFLPMLITIGDAVILFLFAISVISGAIMGAVLFILYLRGREITQRADRMRLRQDIKADEQDGYQALSGTADDQDRTVIPRIDGRTSWHPSGALISTPATSGGAAQLAAVSRKGTIYVAYNYLGSYPPETDT